MDANQFDKLLEVLEDIKCSLSDIEHEIREIKVPPLYDDKDEEVIIAGGNVMPPWMRYQIVKDDN